VRESIGRTLAKHAHIPRLIPSTEKQTKKAANVFYAKEK
jgi:hypothetical protein